MIPLVCVCVCVQVVWAESQYLGCGVTECSENASVIVCNYSPGYTIKINISVLLFPVLLHLVQSCMLVSDCWAQCHL